MVTSISTTVTVDLIDVIAVTAGPIVATTTGIDAIIAATTSVMTGATTIVSMTAMTGVTTERVIAVTTSTITAEMICVMAVAARMTTTVTAATARSDLHHHHHLKEATLMVHFNQLTEKSTSSSVAAKRPKAIGGSDRTQGRSGTSTLKLHNLCVGRSSQSLSLEKMIGSTYQTPRPTSWSLTP
jgi:hypothetical protein